MATVHEQVVRDIFADWNRGDPDAMLARFHPAFTLRLSGLFPGLATDWDGHDGFRRFWDEFRGHWEEFMIEVDHTEPCNGGVLADTRFVGIGRGGIPVSRPFTFVVRLVDGSVVSAASYGDRGKALADAAGGAA